MTAPGDAILAARLCAIDPRLGGIVLRGGDSGDEIAAAWRAMRTDAPMRRLPVHADAEALGGGLDLAATLAAGRPVAQAGLLAAVTRGMLVVPMAERLAEGTAARIAQAIDDGSAGFVTVALDGGRDDEALPPALAERLAFHLDGAGPQHHPAAAAPSIRIAEPDQGGRAAHPPAPHDDASIASALAGAAAALGIASARAPLFALRAARAAALLDGRDAITEADLTLAARLVLAPRATRLPQEAAPEPSEPAPPEASPPAAGDALDDIVLAAARAALPPELLARLAAGRGRGRASGARGAGERRRAPSRGRPAGVRAGVPRGGLRLALVDTLRAAAPWQGVRQRQDGRVAICRDDLRIRRFEARAPATTIFAVDASGSAALARLAEAKGAVELLLGRAYVQRAQVALIAFRGRTAETLLPPTRSLARARRLLGDLPGGGGTPLAAGLDAALALALATRGRGQTPRLVVLTDGRANVARDGGREAADADARGAARAIAAAGIDAAFIDISPRPRQEGERLAAAMGARYLPLPRADAAALDAAIAATTR